MPVLLSDEERCALKGVTDFQFRLYVQGIRPFMDYQTGIVGVKRKISYQSLAEETYTEPGKGLERTGSKSRDQVKRTLRALEKAGLLIAKSIITEKKKQLILECVLAITDSSIKNKAAPYPPHSAALQAAPLENQENPINTGIKQDVYGEGRPESRSTQNEKAAPPPVSVSDDDEKVDFSQQGIFGPFLELISQQGFRLHQVVGNATTMEMIKRWIDKGVTLDQAKTGIKDANIYLGGIPNTPQYYLNRVLQVKFSIDKMNQSVKEVNHAKPIYTNKRHDLRAEAAAVFKRAKEAEAKANSGTV